MESRTRDPAASRGTRSRPLPARAPEGASSLPACTEAAGPWLSLPVELRIEQAFQGAHECSTHRSVTRIATTNARARVLVTVGGLLHVVRRIARGCSVVFHHLKDVDCSAIKL